MSTDTDILERVVKIESDLRHAAAANLRREQLHQETAKTISDIDAKLTKTLLDLERHKGFIGGVLFLAGALWAFIKTGMPYIAKLLGKDV